jgi:Predicted nucleoside-diphosphate-sugar epimerases
MIDRDYKLVTVFGGSGFIGRYVCEELLAAGVRIRVASRDPRSAYYIQPLSQVGQLGLVRADITNRDSVRAAVDGADAVVNLVGSFTNMAKVHSTGAANIAEAARDSGAKQLVHISAMSADQGSDAGYSRTKGQGENAVRKAFPDATIIRPSIVFGSEDQLTNQLAAMSRLLPVVPVIAGKCRFQPVFVEDLAKAIAAAAVNPAAHAGKTYEIGGPQVFTMRELTQQILAAAGRDTALADVPAPIASLISWFGFLPGAPLTRDQWLMLQRDNVASEGAPGLEAFGIKPTPFAAVAPGWLGMYGGNRFARRRVNLTANT